MRFNLLTKKTALWVSVCLVEVILGLSLLIRLSEDVEAPRILSVHPSPGELGVAVEERPSINFSKSLKANSVKNSSFALRDDQGHLIAAQVSYELSPSRAILSPVRALLPGRQYTVVALGGLEGIVDRRGRPLSGEKEWEFTTGTRPTTSLTEGPGGPILLVVSDENPFSKYYAEILRNEGFNEFTTVDISDLSLKLLKRYDVAIVGEMHIKQEQVRIAKSWVQEGGHLVLMRPEAIVAKEFGMHAAAAHQQLSLHDAYLALDPKSEFTAGLIHVPIQFHGPADEYLPCANAVAALYLDKVKPLTSPAVCQNAIGRGTATVFSYDLAKSVVYTRQGNPLWSGMERDGNSPVRSDDLFYGHAASDPKPDWVDPEKIAIPQADEQQRMLANILTLTTLSKMPLPHLWYLPRGLKAAVVMTGDDHGRGATVGRFEQYMNESQPGCSVEDWECIRGTTNVFVGSIPAAKASYFASQGFEIALHVFTQCADWPTTQVRQPDGVLRPSVVRDAANALYDRQLANFAKAYAGVPAPVSNRIDCVTWGDYDTQPQVEYQHGIRFDTNYYYWPPKWVQDRPGLFNGSGMPMRFARQDGEMIDVYQAATQMTDESKQSYPQTVDLLLANALGDPSYYAVFTVNMHHDWVLSPGANAILASTRRNHIPIVTAAQMLTWLDGRNSSSFRNLSWSNGQLDFTIEIGTGANGLQALLPLYSSEGGLSSLTLNGVAVDYKVRRIAGLQYAAFAAGLGQFIATYRDHPSQVRSAVSLKPIR